MKNKILTIFVVLVIASSSLFAAYNYPQLFYPNTTFKPISTRLEAMGGAGVAIASGGDTLFYNPANLGSKEFSLNTPSITITLFNPLNILTSELIDDLQNLDDLDMEDPTEIFNFAQRINNIFGHDKGEVLTTDISLGFTAGGFGLGINVQEQLHTSNNHANNPLSLKLIAEVNAALSLGYGYRFNVVPDILSIDAGVNVRFVYKAYTGRMGALDVLDLVSNNDEDANILDSLMSEIRLAAGWALPIDVGVNFNLPIGFRVSAVARDLNGKLTMQDYDELGLWIKDINEFIGSTNDSEYTPSPGAESRELIHEVPWKLDLGLAWAPSFGNLDKFFKPTIAVDFVDTIAMFEKVGDDPNVFWNHLKAGAEIKLLSVLDLRGGFNQGYYSVGVGLDLYAVRIDASYYWREFGSSIGDKAVDALSVRVNLGFDR